MENQRLNSDLRDKLHDLESPFNERVSFEAVMKKRERKKRRAILWIPSMVVVAGLFVVGGLGMLWVSTDQSPEKAPQVTLAKSVYKPKLAQKGTLNSAQRLTLGGASASSETASPSFMMPEALSPETTSPEIGSAEIATAEAATTSERKTKSPEIPQSPVKVAQEETPVAVGGSMAETPELNETNAPEVLHQDMFCDPQGLKLVEYGLSDPNKNFVEIPEGENEAQWDPARLQSKWYVEVAATTGSRVVINFNEDDRLSILGNIYHANYHGLILKDVGSGVMLGTGLSYGEMVGTGEWRIREFQERMNIDTYDVVVMLPPVQTVRVYDTTYSQVRVETAGSLNYRIDKFAIPLAARYNFMFGKMAWRAAAQFNPGMTIKSSGDFFGKTEYAPLPTQRMLTMDMKLAVGPAISIYKDWILILEPNIMHHAFRDPKLGKTKGKTLTGFGVSMQYNF